MTKYYHENGQESDSPTHMDPIDMPPKYEWLVTMEIAEMPRIVQADTADEAMEKAELFWQLKEMDLDKLPRLICTSAQIQDVTNAYRDKTKILIEEETYKRDDGTWNMSKREKETRDNFKGFLQENPTWSKKKRIEDDVERRLKEYQEKKKNE